MPSWFACPVCGRDLDDSGDGRACSSGHRFEGARRGYLALVDGRSPLIRSTPAAELDAVELSYAAVGMDAVVADVLAMLPARRGLRILDAGFDLGHSARAILAARPDVAVLSVSASPSALARSTARSGAEGLLADPSRPWPLREGVADVALCTFGEVRPAEFHRVLAAGGLLLAASGQSEAHVIADDAYPWFEHDQSRTAPGAAGEPVVLTRFRRRRRILTWG